MHAGVLRKCSAVLGAGIVLRAHVCHPGQGFCSVVSYGFFSCKPVAGKTSRPPWLGRVPLPWEAATQMALTAQDISSDNRGSAMLYVV